ncbi:MAG: hypothetical protein ACTSVU_05845 [Promethearchaeota archaeon]
MSMYRRFLQKRHFSAQTRSNGTEPNCYFKHDVRTGGIYAKLQHRGVSISTKQKTQFFDNFDDLERYLDQLYLSTRDDSSEFLQILNRRSNAKRLRQIPL